MCARVDCAVSESGVLSEADVAEEGLRFPDVTSLRGTSWHASTDRAVVPRSTALQLMRAQQRGKHAPIFLIYSNVQMSYNSE